MKIKRTNILWFQIKENTDARAVPLEDEGYNHSRGSVFEAVSEKYRSTIYRLPMLLPKIHIDLKVYDIQ